MIQILFKKEYLVTLIFISCLFLFTKTSNSQTFSISPINLDKVHSFNNLNTTTNKFAVPNKFNARGLNGSQQLVPAYNYFYEFADGTYYISESSYINRTPIGDNEFEIDYDNSSVVFKATKIYDEEDEEEEMRLQMGNNLLQTTLLNNRSKSVVPNNSDQFELKISHINNSIILGEEYVVVINIPPNFEAENILLLYNEDNKEIFTDNGLMTPRPAEFKGRTPAFVATLKDNESYENYLYFENTSRNIFFNLKTKSTLQFSAGDIFTIKAFSIIDNETISEQIDLQLKFLGNKARAHDPNDILVKPTCIDKKNMPTELEYTIRFQNIGAAPATNVMIDVEVPNAIDMGSINTNSFFVNTFSQPNLRLPAPNYTFNINQSKKTIEFKLIGINLVGLNQPGITEEKKTIGSIKIKLPLKTNYNKKPISCIAKILFEDGLEDDDSCKDLCDPNESCLHLCDANGTYPALDTIKTEPAITTYKKFHSLKINKAKVGLDYIIENNAPGIFAGISAAPSACKPGIYNQYELSFAYNRYVCNGGTIDTATCFIYAADNNNEITEWEVESSIYSIGLVPLQLRYDLSNTSSIGAGVEVRGAYTAGKFYQLTTGLTERNDLLLDAAVFADFNFVTNSINYGLRYLYGYRYNFSDNGIANEFIKQRRAQLYVQLSF